jgi:hypothetical protein
VSNVALRETTEERSVLDGFDDLLDLVGLPSIIWDVPSDQGLLILVFGMTIEVHNCLKVLQLLTLLAAVLIGE